MKRLGLASTEWVFYVTTALLLSAVVVRSILVYGGSPVLPAALVALIAWSVLFLVEAEISRRWPPFFTVYLVLQTALALYLLSFPGFPDSYAVLFFPPSMQAMQRLSLRRAIVWIVAFVALIGLSVVRAYGPVQGLAFTPIFAGGIALGASYAYGAHRAQAGRAHSQALARELEEANRELEQYSRQVEQLAAARERQNLARDLHDSVTQTVFSMTLTTQSALLLLDREPSRVSAQLDRLNQLAQSALSEMRVLVSKLDREQIAERGLAAALREHLRRPEMAMLEVSLEIQGPKS